MGLAGRNPHRMRGRHHPLPRARNHRHQAAIGAQQLAARMLVHGGVAQQAVVAAHGDQRRAASRLGLFGGQQGSRHINRWQATMAETRYSLAKTPQ
ncbi:hypothetical protein D3C77_647810 [compost metagenome]